MAVFTQVSPEDATSFLQRYQNLTFLELAPIPSGSENSNYFVDTNQGRFVLTLYEHRTPSEDLPFFLTLMQHTHERALRCSHPVADNQGNLFSTLCGKPAALLSFLEGASPTKPTPSHCRAIGTTLAEFHLATKNFPLSRANTMGHAHWANLAAPLLPRAHTIHASLHPLVEEELAFLHAHWPTSLPVHVVHGDLFPDNALFHPTLPPALIDFYFACNEPVIYDLAICLNAWCFDPDGAFNITKARALINAYSHSRPLSTDEINLLPLFARGTALRFLLTRLHDTLLSNHPTNKNPMEYAHHLRFHQRAVDATSYGLSL